MLDELRHLVKLTNLKAYKFKSWDLGHYRQRVESSLENLYEMAASKNLLGGGVYRMYDAAGEIIYVGKSNNLHRRLLQHIGKRTNSHYFIDEVVKIEWHNEDNPILQTTLEGIFIAYHMPRYNDEVKDYMEREWSKQL